jgi:hypothetical protein
LKKSWAPDEPKLHEFMRAHFDRLKDYMSRQELYSFVHAKGYFQHD